MSIVYSDNDTTQATRAPLESDLPMRRHGHIWRDLSDPDGQYLYCINKFVKVGGSGSKTDLDALISRVNTLEQAQSNMFSN